MPTFLVISLVHFGPSSRHSLGDSFLAKALVRLTSLSKEERSALETPPSDAAGKGGGTTSIGIGAADAAAAYEAAPGTLLS